MIIVDKLLNKNLVKEAAGISYVDLPSVLRCVEAASKVTNFEK